jgi:hypothetical protein
MHGRIALSLPPASGGSWREACWRGNRIFSIIDFGKPLFLSLQPLEGAGGRLAGEGTGYFRLLISGNRSYSPSSLWRELEGGLHAYFLIHLFPNCG